MSALWAYVDAVGEHEFYLAKAFSLDKYICHPHVRQPAPDDRHRKPTRQDWNREVFLEKMAEIEELNLEFNEYDAARRLVPRTRVRTRLDFIRRRRFKFATVHAAALAEAQEFGIYPMLAPKLVDCTQLVMRLYAAYRGADDEELSLDAIEELVDDAVRDLRLYLPARAPVAEENVVAFLNDPPPPSWLTSVANGCGSEDGVAQFYVTLQQMASIVQRNKKTLERMKDKTELPPPDIKAPVNGAPDEWLWSTVRPILEKKFCRDLPESYPKLTK